MLGTEVFAVCAVERLFAPASSHLASQVGCGNEIAALRGAAEQQMEKINQ